MLDGINYRRMLGPQIRIVRRKRLVGSAKKEISDSKICLIK